MKEDHSSKSDDAEGITSSERRSERMWWGDFKLSPNEGGIWRIGPLRLWIFHDENEWRLGHEHSSDPLDDALELQGTMRRMPVEAFDINRFASNSKSETIQLVPRVADRPVVSQPDNPFHVMPGNEICVYLSTPVWIQVRTDNETLVDIPSFRPSDTWFGADTTSGELCYASITMVRLNQNNLPRRCNRALTCLHIKNHASDPLVLDHLKLPVPNLSLYTDSRAQLWTQSLRVERDEDGAMAQIRLEPHPPPELGETELVSEARTPMEENVFARAMNALMSHSKESKS